MKEFQIAAFIGSIIFYIGVPIGIITIVVREIRKDKRKWESKKEMIICRILGIIFLLIISVPCVLMVSTKIVDIPMLIKGDFCIVEGKAHIEDSNSRDMHQHVYIDDTEVNFFINSNMKEDEEYRVTYLPNSGQGIEVEKVKSYKYAIDGKENDVKGPWKKFLVLIICTIAFFLLSPIAFLLLIISSVIFYILNGYLYIKFAMTSGVWFSERNEAFVNIVLGLVMFCVFVVCYCIERIFVKKKLRADRFYDDYYTVSRSVAMIVIFIYFATTAKYYNIN